MHKNTKNQKNTRENEILSFNEITLDPMKIAQLEELDDAGLEAVVGGANCNGYICVING